MRDERRVADPRSELGAGVVNLFFWLAGGLGACAPKAVLAFDPDAADAPGVAFAAFSWDQRVYRDLLAPFPYFTVAPSLGDFDFEFDPLVPGMGSDDLELEFSGGVARAVGLPGDSLDGRYRGSLVMAGPRKFTVAMLDTAGTHVHVPFGVVLW